MSLRSYANNIVQLMFQREIGFKTESFVRNRMAATECAATSVAGEAHQEEEFECQKAPGSGQQLSFACLFLSTSPRLKSIQRKSRSLRDPPEFFHLLPPARADRVCLARFLALGPRALVEVMRGSATGMPASSDRPPQAWFQAVAKTSEDGAPPRSEALKIATCSKIVGFHDAIDLRVEDTPVERHIR
ncbi:hypothetical protein BC629DRAFT_1441959 [Irpex lacteus]|nr:hypothetical protein BC629DRAFT_1441959 [Irpex lacteus]